MKISAIKKSSGEIWIAHGDASLAMEDGDQLIELPQDWEKPDPKYRSCLAEKDGEIVIDLAKAKVQKIEEIRKARDEKLKESDVEFMVAMSQDQASDVITAIKEKKQALRDITEMARNALASKKKIETVDAYEPEWP